jgi:hypothetical protein
MKNRQFVITGLVLMTIFLALSFPVKGKTESRTDPYYSDAGQGESKSEKIRRLKLKLCEGDLDILYGIYRKGENLLRTIEMLMERAAYDAVYEGVAVLLEEAEYDTLVFLRTVDDQIYITEKICKHIALERYKSDLYYPGEGPKKSKSEIIGGLKLLLCGPDLTKFERTYHNTQKLTHTIQALLDRIPTYSKYSSAHSELEAAANDTRVFLNAVSYQIHTTKNICDCIASGCSKSELIKDADIAIESELPSPNLLLLLIWELYD